MVPEGRKAQEKNKRILTGLYGTQGRVLKPLVSTSVSLWSDGLWTGLLISQ